MHSSSGVLNSFLSADILFTTVRRPGFLSNKTYPIIFLYLLRIIKEFK